jgi:hypothetical protein
MASSLVATWHPLRAPAFRRRSHNRRSISVSVSRCALDERTVIESYNSLNGNGNGKGIRYEDTAKESTNGKFDVNLENSSNGNGRLVKYETANGVAFKSGNEQAEERERKKRIEEIGREDAWFKADGGQQPQVNSFQFESHNASGYPILVFNIQYFKSNNFQYFKSSWNSAPPYNNRNRNIEYGYNRNSNVSLHSIWLPSEAISIGGSSQSVQGSIEAW